MTYSRHSLIEIPDVFFPWKFCVNKRLVFDIFFRLEIGIEFGGGMRTCSKL